MAPPNAFYRQFYGRTVANLYHFSANLRIEHRLSDKDLFIFQEIKSRAKIRDSILEEHLFRTIFTLNS